MSPKPRFYTVSSKQCPMTCFYCFGSIYCSTLSFLNLLNKCKLNSMSLLRRITISVLFCFEFLSSFVQINQCTPPKKTPTITTTWFNWPQQLHRGVWLGLCFKDQPRNNKLLCAQANPENFLLLSLACGSQTHSLAPIE